MLCQAIALSVVKRFQQPHPIASHAATAAAVQEATPIPAADAADLFQLAINCRSSETAAAAIRQLQHRLEPTATRRLLVTVLMRHGSAAAYPVI
jgi:hypothetical protein